MKAGSNRGTAPRFQFVAWAFVALAILYLTVVGGGAFTGLYIVEMRIISVASVVLAILVWLVVAARDPGWRPTSAVAPAMGAVLAALAVSLATSSHPTIGLDYLGYAVLLAGAYLILQRLFAHAYFAARLGSLAVLLCLSLSVIYIVVVVLTWVDMWSYLGRYITPPLRPDYEALTYGNPSAIAAAVILLWLASAAHLGFGTGRSRAIVLVLGALTAAVVFLSGSRGAWAGLAIAGAIVVPAWMLVGANRRAILDLVRSRSVRIGAGVALLGGVVLAVAFLPTILSRLAEPASDLRSSLGAAAWRMFLEHPATGVGPGMFVVERASHALPTEIDYYVAHAHDIFVQTVAELGIVGVIAGLVVAVNVGLLIRRGIRSDDPLRRRLGWAALAGVLYLMAHQLFDFYANMPAIGFFLALSVARLDALTTRQTTPAPGSAGSRTRWPAWAPGVAMVAILVGSGLATAWLGRTESLALAARDATTAANEGDWPVAMARAQAAVDGDPDMPPYLFTLGLAAANSGDLDLARDAFARTAALDNYPTSWLNLAGIETALGHDEAAATALENAMRLGRIQPQVAVGAASLYVVLGDDDAAASAASDALADAPGLAGDPYWMSSPGLTAAWKRGLQQALERIGPEQAYELALEAGQPKVAERIVSALPEPTRVNLQLVIDAWDGDAAAFQAVRARAAASPLDALAVSLCVRVAFHAQDALGLDPTTWNCDRVGYAYSPILYRVGPPPTSREFIPGPNATWHFQGAYERFVPFNELIPGLPSISPV